VNSCFIKFPTPLTKAFIYKGNTINVLSLINVPTNCSSVKTEYDDKVCWCDSSVSCQYTILGAVDANIPLEVCMPG